MEGSHPPIQPPPPERSPLTPTNGANSNRDKWTSALLIRTSLLFGVISSGINLINSFAEGDVKRGIFAGIATGIGIIGGIANERGYKVDKKSPSI